MKLAMMHRLKCLGYLACGLITGWTALGQNVILNELMYHPSPDMPEPVNREWIEIFNRDATNVNLNGWTLSGGVDFLFTNVTLPARGYLVVAADRAAFTNQYPAITNVVGNWIGKLGNNGQTLRLRNALGVEINQVDYASQGDWATRLRGPGERQVTLTRSGTTVTAYMFGHDMHNGDQVRIYGADQPEYNGIFSITTGTASTFTFTISGSPVTPATGLIICRQLTDLGYSGWSWSTLADGLGRSLELVNANLPNEHGQNWTNSIVMFGTPGAPNSVANNNIAPIILETRHSPLLPTSTNTVTISARFLDDGTNGVTGTVYWRLDNYSTATNAFAALPMFDDGGHGDGGANDGVFAAEIPAQASPRVVEFYVEAMDADFNRRTWPAPALDPNDNPMQQANALYQVVDSPIYTGAQPIYYMVMTYVETNELRQAQINNNACNATANATFISVDGVETLLRYNVAIRNRGAGTRSAQPMNLRGGFPNDRPFKGVTAIHLNTQYVPSQMAGYALGLRGGIDVEAARVVQVRWNGQNRANSGSPQYGSYIHLEAADSDYAANHYPNDPNGNVYRGSRYPWTANLTYYGADSNVYEGQLGNGYYKTSNSSENDWRDLIEVSRVLDQVGNTAPEAVYTPAVRQVVNVEQWMRSFAVFNMLGSGETAFQTGRGDDYYMYRGINDPRVVLLAHDFDSVLGQSGAVGATEHLFRMCPFMNSTTGRDANATVLNRFMTNAAFVPLFYKAHKELLDGPFSNEQASRTLDEALGDWVPAVANSMKMYITNRNAYVRSQIPLDLTVTYSLPVSNGYPYTTVAMLNLSGRANVIETRSIRVNGSNAVWTAWQGNWQGTAALKPGINRILIESLGTNNYEVARTNIEVWYDTGSWVPVGDVVANTTWTATGGPYLVSSPIAVNATLTIEPGATVYFAPDASMTVGGSLRAEGTATQRIRFASQPGVPGGWAGMSFYAPGSRIAFADFDGADAGSFNFEVADGDLYVENVTWRNTTKPIITLADSSLLVRDSTFPAMAGSPHIRAVTIPPGGYFIVSNNVFGATSFDNIEATGAARPGAVVQALDNAFTGTADDAIDLRGADAHIEGNSFLHIRKAHAVAGDSSSAIACGRGVYYGTPRPSQVVAVRNLFFDVDHVALVKEGSTLSLENNTALGIATAVVNFSEPELGTLPGAGASLDGDIFWNPAGYSGTNFQNRFPTNGTVQLAVNRSIFWAADGLNNGVGNLREDPRLANMNTNSITARTIHSDFRLLGGPGIASGPNGLDRGGLVPAGASVSGEPVSPTPLTSAVLTIAGPGITHYRYRLNAGAFGTETSVTNPITLFGLTNGSYSVAVIGKNSAGVWQSQAASTVSRTWIVNTSETGILINEVLAQNSSLQVNGTTPDLVELFNAGPYVIDLGKMGLTDDPADPYQFTFPVGLVLEPGQYLALFADNDAGPGVHLGFGLNQDSDGLYLFDTPERGSALVDSVAFGQQVADLSVGRLPGGDWGLTVPTFTGPNMAKATGDPHRLLINEWLANGSGIYAQDYVELYNPEPLPVKLGGLYFTENPIGWPTQFLIAPLCYIPAGGYVTFVADGNTNAGLNHLNFRLSGDRGVIALLDSQLVRIDDILYGPQTTDIAQGRRPSGSDTIGFISPPTPGIANPGAIGSIIVSNYNVNLLPLVSTWRHNSGGVNLDGTGWQGVGYTDSGWPSGSTLFAHGVASPPIPVGVNIPWTSPQQTAFYFRTYFNLAVATNNFSLTTTFYIDDGAVFYLNGREVYRHNMNPGSVFYSTLAQNNIGGDPGMTGPIIIPMTNLVAGSNVLAVEVHQGTTTSGDMDMAVALDLSQWTTQYVGKAVVLNEILANNNTATNLNGTISDWVELYNPTGTNIDLAGMVLAPALNRPERWTFPAGVVIAPATYLVVNFDPDAPASTNNAASLNTGFNLSANGDEVWLLDAQIRGGAPLDNVVFGLQASDLSIGRLPNGSGSWVLTQPTPGVGNSGVSLGDPAQLRINEWMAKPNPGDDDWFEIYNPNPQPVSLSGLYLTDRLDRPTKHAIAPLSFIGSFTNGFARFIADNQTTKGADHVSFGLDGDAGEALGIFPPQPAPAIASVQFGPQQQNVSEGCLPDGLTNGVTRFPESASPGDSNYLPLENVVINEVLTHTDLPLEDAVELRNRTDVPVDISGWYLSDSRDNLRKFRLPPTNVPPYGFVVFYEYQFNEDPRSLTSFALSSTRGEKLYLSTADALGNFTGYRDEVSFGAAENGVTFGRYELSDGVDFPAQAAMTLGTNVTAQSPTNMNLIFRDGKGASNSYPRIGPVVITEIMYHPPEIGTNDNVADEFVELRNITATNVPLYHPVYTTNVWRIREGVDFDFPPGTVLSAGGYAILVSFEITNAAAVAAFTNKYGVPAGVPIYGPYRGKLDNGGEPVELQKPDDVQLSPPPDAGYVPRVVVDRVRYNDMPPWPMLADGNTNGVGYSLQRRFPAEYANDPVNWQAGTPTPGRATGAPAVAIPVITGQPTNVVVAEGANASFSVTASGAEPMLFQWRFNGKVIAGVTSNSLTIVNAQSNHVGSYTVLAMNAAGAAVSLPATLYIQSPPRILTQPQSLVVSNGATATFTVVASGAPPLRYQWRKGLNPISGATNYGYSITNVQAADEANYSVVITNNYGAITSAVANLAIYAPPVITAQPQDLTVFQGDTADFSVTVSGSPPLRYQWRREGVPIAEATNATLTLGGVQTNQAGNYSVVVTNDVGTAISTVARLTVNPVATVTVVATDPNASETGPDSGTFTFTRSPVTASALAVNFSRGGSAANGTDYQPIASPVTIPANTASATITVTPINDSAPESNETVIVTLSSGAGYILGSPSNATVTILDNDNLPPSVTITNPLDAALFRFVPTNITVSAQATDAEGTVARVEFYNRVTNKIGEALSQPFTMVWTNAPTGTNLLTAVATDSFGSRGTSAPVSIIVNARPSVSITNPLNNASFLPPANITIHAAASDSDGTVTQVVFYAGSIVLGTSTVSPYSITWSNVDLGTYLLTARATDNRGAASTSAVVTVSVTTGTLAFTDMFADRNTVSGSFLTVIGSNDNATAETGEVPPNATGYRRNNRTVWISWRATYSGQVVMDTFGSTFDTLMGVCTGTAVSSQTIIVRNDDFGSTNQSRVTFAATAGTTYNIQVAGYLNDSSFGAIALHINAASPVPTITGQPQSQTVARGATATFTVGASGAAPLSYQWRFNGADIPGANSASLALANVQGYLHEGTYSVLVTNTVGWALSSDASLRVSDGLVTTQQVSLLSFTNYWRYRQDGVDLQTAWRDVGYDDSSWLTGQALFAAETFVYPEPFRTPLSLSNGSVATLTFYFRTHFTSPSAGAGALFISTNYVDDGTVYYLNGQEMGRLRIGPGAVGYSTLATNLPTEGVADVLNLPATNLVAGDNLLAVELHQTSSTSSDVVFGMNIQANLAVTNGPVLSSPALQGNGSMALTLTGVAGRLYAVDYTNSLPPAHVEWPTLTLVTNLTGSVQIMDGSDIGQGRRFYRARLVR